MDPKISEFVQVKRLIKSLEIVAEGEQEAMLKEQEEKMKEERERIEKEIKEREEKGLPPLTEEELKAKEAKKDKKTELMEF